MAKIGALLAKISGEVGAVRKDDYNSGMKFNFRGIDAVVNACHRKFAENGVSVAPQILTADYVDILIGRNKSPGVSVRLIVEYVFTGPEGDQITVRVPGEGQDQADKGTAKAMSVALRIALLQALMLPTDEPDPDSTWEQQEPAPPEFVALRMRAIEIAQAKGIPGPDLAAEFQAVGGEGKVSAAENVEALRALIEALEGAAGADS